MKLQLAAAFALVILAAPMAHAFTIDDKSNTNSSGGARYTDPDARFEGGGSGTGGGSTLQQGNTTIRFGGAQQGGTFDQRYDSNRMFDTLGGPGRDGFR